MESRTEIETLNHLEKCTSKQRVSVSEMVRKSCKYIKTAVELRVVESCLTVKTVNQIAEHTGIHAPAVSRLLQSMTDQGRDSLLIVKTNKDDTRFREIKATKKAAADYMRFKKAAGEA